MPTFYHGTSRAFATAMCGSAGNPAAIDVRLGGGEFGNGFYTQDSVSNALRRGYSRHGSAAAVLVLTIDDIEYGLLRIKRLNLDQAQRLDARLAGKARHTFTSRHDAIVGTLVNQSNIMQQKFQTVGAGNLLNGPHTQRTIHP